MGWSESDPEYQSRLRVFVQELARLGWVDGVTVQIMQRWTDGDVDRALIMAKVIVEWQPEVILAGTTPATAALHRETRSVPIVFVSVADPIGAGFAGSLNRPGGNITGFINDEVTLAGKQLGLLKEMAPLIKRVAIMFNPDTAPGGGTYYLASFEAAARTLGLQPVPARVRSASDIRSAIGTLGHEKDGLVLMNDSFLIVHMETIISTLQQSRVPAIFDAPQFAENGGLIAYGPIYSEMYRRAAGYVDRILRGAKPIELPTRFNLVINLKTANALGLTIPETLLATADEVIQ
jgi:putative tryptophan/tyrosine transport system substrate-binding protein